MICDGSVMVMSTSHVNISTMIDINVIISPTILCNCTYLTCIAHIWVYKMRRDEMRFLHLIMSFILYQDGYSALYLAAMYVHTDVVRLLLDRGADVNIKDKVSGMI